MTTVESSEPGQQPTSRRGIAKAAVAALALVGFGAAALKGVLTSQDGDAEAVGIERRRRRRGRRRRNSGGRNSGGRRSGGRNSGGDNSGGDNSGGDNSGGDNSGEDD